MSIDTRNLGAPSEIGFSLGERDGTLVITLQKHFDTTPYVSLWACEVVRACPGPYARVEVDCSHHASLSSTILAGLVRLADEYCLPQGRRLVLTGTNDRIRRAIARIHLDDLLECPPAA